MAIDLPTRFIGHDDGTATNGFAERRIGRLSLPGRAMQRARDGDGQAEPLSQEPGHLAMRQPELLVEDHDQREDPRPELHRGGPKRVRGLQWVAALHAPATRGATAYLDVQLPHTWRHNRHVFLILHRHSRRGDRTGTVWTRRWHRHRDDFVDARGWWPMPMAAVAQSGAAPAAPRRRHRRALREGRRLTVARPASQVELVLQPLVFAVQPVAFALQPDPLRFRPLKLPPQSLDFPFDVPPGFRPIRHIEVMPDPGSLYKSKMFGMKPLTR